VSRDLLADARGRSIEPPRDRTDGQSLSQASGDLLAFGERQHPRRTTSHVGHVAAVGRTTPWIEPGCLPSTRPISLSDSPPFHRAHSSRFCSAVSPGRPLCAIQPPPDRCRTILGVAPTGRTQVVRRRLSPGRGGPRGGRGASAVASAAASGNRTPASRASSSQVRKRSIGSSPRSAPVMPPAWTDGISLTGGPWGRRTTRAERGTERGRASGP
jgi:hypothetical protein